MVAYYAETPAGQVFVTREGELVYSLAPGEKSKRAWSLTESFVGGIGHPRGEREAATRLNYFIGSDSAEWRGGIVTYEEISLGKVWPGVSVSLRTTGASVEKLFILEPGVAASRIRVEVAGAKSLRLNSNGALNVSTGVEDVVFTRPVAYQELRGARRPVEVSYELFDREYGFRVGDHDPRHAVVIDPVLQATYLGGSGYDPLYAIAIHPQSGDVYVAGSTSSIDFPGTAGGAQQTSGGSEDAYVARLDGTLTVLRQTTYLGGRFSELGLSLAVHPTTGQIYVGGQTSSSDFPGTSGGVQPLSGGSSDAFLARFDASLTTLHQATYLGGSGFDGGFALGIDATSGAVLVAGETSSVDFPATAGGAQPANGGILDAFVARLDAALVTLTQATYLGGNSTDLARALAIHPASGAVFVAGETGSSSFPGTSGGAQQSIAGASEAFLARFSADLTTLTQSTFFGGSRGEGGLALAIHAASGEIYLAGYTNSVDIPGTAGGAQQALAGSRDAFVARFNGALTGLTRASYLGGNSDDFARGVMIHPVSGEVYVTGQTLSPNFPRTMGGAQPTIGRGFGYDAFVARVRPDLTSLTQATYLGGSGGEESVALALHATSGDVFLAGLTGSTDLPATAGGLQVANAGSGDSFVVRLTADLAGAPSIAVPLTRGALGFLFLGLVSIGLFILRRNH